jgi:quinol monooxygenase YgiN
MAAMYARSTTLHGDPRSVGEAIDQVRDQALPTVHEMPGCVGLSMLADRETGRCIITTSWRDEEAMRASREGVRSAQHRTIELLGGRPEMVEWDIAALHRLPESGHGTCSRVTWLTTAPGAVGKAVDAVRLSLMPKLEDLAGFCSVSVMVRPAEGLAVSTVSYVTRADLERSAEGSRQFQEEFAPTMGVEVTETAEFDLAIAHLRVPETL